MNDTSLLRLHTVNRPYAGEAYSGDWPFYYLRDNDLVLGLVDGLGHGKMAYASSMRIKAFLDSHWHAELDALLDELHLAVRGGQGAAICMVHVGLDCGALSCLGVGNVRAWLLGSQEQRFVSRDGVLGQHYRTPLVQTAQLSKGDKLVLASDGIQERLFTQCDRAELSRDPISLANYLLRHYGKVHDDASCLVYEF